MSLRFFLRLLRGGPARQVPACVLILLVTGCGGSGDPTGPVGGGNGTVTVAALHTFDGSDGSTPVGRLVQGDDGYFYGVTRDGGAGGCGTIFRITPAGEHTILRSLTGDQDGCQPETGLTRGPEAEETYYGVARYGGSGNVGTAFRITPGGAFTVIHHFAFPGDTPRAPIGRLLLGADGSLYGTSAGPLHGTIFRLGTDGEVSVIHTFAGGVNGALPHTGLTVGADGNFYGATVFGGEGGATTSNGIVFRVSPTGAFEVLHDITEGRSHPYDGPLVFGPDGNLYGTTVQGGAAAMGIAYRITPSGEFTSYSMIGFDGSSVVGGPGGGLFLASDGNFYGSATTFIRMTPEGAITRLTGSVLPGGALAGGVLQGSDGAFYGLSRGPGDGTVFRITGLDAGAF